MNKLNPKNKICFQNNGNIHINLKLNKLTKNSKSKIKNLCLITNKTNSIYRPFNLIRHSFRKNALNGELIGIKKSSW